MKVADKWRIPLCRLALSMWVHSVHLRPSRPFDLLSQPPPVLFLPLVAVICTFIVFNLPANSLSGRPSHGPTFDLCTCLCKCGNWPPLCDYHRTSSTLWSSKHAGFLGVVSWPECRKMGRWSHKLVRSGPQQSFTVIDSVVYSSSSSSSPSSSPQFVC